MKNRLLLSLAFLLIFVSSLVYLGLNHYLDSPNDNTQNIRVIIPRGHSVKKIAKELVRNNIIHYPKFFWMVHRFLFSDYPLQAGEYEIPAHSSIRNIIEMMYEGRVVIHKLTILEGVYTKEILDKIQNEPMLIGDITTEFHEGDLLADTYHYTYGETKMMLLNRIYQKSQDIIDELWAKRAANLPLANKEQAVILASIIEKETGIANERSRIASVFVNRLRKKMRLQADPTVIYAITKGQYVFTRSITKSDLKIKSLYNSYLYVGLPPTAIAAPGRAALEAALNPMDTKDLYFVVDGKGGHNFSSTLAEHNQHVSNYRKREANKNAQ